MNKDTNHDQYKKQLGDRTVPCIITGRYLEFPKRSEAWLDAGEAMRIRVMKYNGVDEKRRQLCELVIMREDLLDAIRKVQTPDE